MKELNTLKDYRNAGGDSNPLILFVGEKERSYKSFENVANSLKDHPKFNFYKVDLEKADKELIEDLGINEPRGDYYIRVRHPQGAYRDYHQNAIKEDDLARYVTSWALRDFDNDKVQLLTQDDMDNIKMHNLTAMIMFEGNSKNDDYLWFFNDGLNNIYSLAFVTDFSSTVGEELAEVLQTQIEETPQLWILDYTLGYDQPVKYKYNLGEISSSKFIRFLREYRNKQMARTLISENILEGTYHNNILKLSSKLFQSKVNEASKDVLVYFYRDNCSNCEEYNEVIEELAQKSKKMENLKNVIFAKINLSKNDLKFDQDSPAIRLYPSHHKTGILFTEDISKLEKWIDGHKGKV